jgi:hypothetical protein
MKSGMDIKPKIVMGEVLANATDSIRAEMDRAMRGSPDR